MDQVLDLSIESLVPHDRPMLLLDAMIEYSGKTSRCRTTIRPGSPFIQADGVPAIAGIEYMAQAVAAHGGYQALQRHEPVQEGFLLGTPKFQSKVSLFPLGQILLIEVEEDWGEGELRHFLCRIYDHETGALLQETGLNVFQPRDVRAYLDMAQASREVGGEDSP